MSPIGTPVAGAYPLTSVADLPNVTIANPGERWSDRKASGTITPGEAIVPASDGRWRVAGSADAPLQMAVARRTVDVPDLNGGSIYNEALGPNEISNLPIANGDYVLALFSGQLHLTLVEPLDTYKVGDLIRWDAAGARPTGKTGTGVWTKTGATADNAVFEVSQPYRNINDDDEGVLTVRFLRGGGLF